jgi:Kef-type K+ transport system membrane component KefB
MGRRVLTIVVIETAVTGVLVTTLLLLVGLAWPIALILGCIAMPTAPAATMMVLREYDSSGPLTDTIIAVVAVNNIVVLVAFTMVATVVTLGQGMGAEQSVWVTVGHSAFWLIWELAGSVALGYLVGLMLAGWGSKLTEHGEAQILLAGSVLFCIGVALLFELSPLIASMAVGVTVVNLSGTSHRLAGALSRFDPPIYAIFFVIAGAGIEIDRLTTLGLAGGAFILARTTGKVFGFRLGCYRSGFPVKGGLWLGLSMLALADLAVGLTIEVARRFPELRSSVSPIVLGAVAVYETLGPIGTRLAILRSGEAAAGTTSRGPLGRIATKVTETP